jgi:predicted transcriptional regulator
MARDAKDVTEAELGLLQILWDRGTATIRQIADLVYPEANAAQYATIQKQLERLEAKGFVRRDRSMFVHVFSAAVERDELIGRRIREMADKLCGGSLAPILTHLARATRLSGAERRALRDLVDRLDPPRENPKPPPHPKAGKKPEGDRRE